MDIETISAKSLSFGLVLRGGFLVTSHDNVPVHGDGRIAKTLLMFGQTGSSVWAHFSRSPEFKDGQPDPMDRWSERIGGNLADALNGELLLPSGGPPHHPFISWAKRSEAVQSSRLGMLIHPNHGLWHAYRLAISLSIPISGLCEPSEAKQLCDSCVDEPCLSACPVGAFDGVFFDVHACTKYLRLNPDGYCRSEGCKARDACPEGRGSRYDQDQRNFHMQQFLLGMMRREAKE